MADAQRKRGFTQTDLFDDAGRRQAPPEARQPPPKPGPGRCPECRQYVENYPLAGTGSLIALIPGEYPAARVPEDAAAHVSRGLAWEGYDGGRTVRITHESICPAGPEPGDHELYQMWLRLRIRARRSTTADPQA